MGEVVLDANVLIGLFRLPDALVIATGIVDDATVLTCDKRLADVDSRVQVVNPDPDRQR